MNIYELIDLSLSPFLFTWLLLVCSVVGVSIPSGPGGLGPFQQFAKFGFILAATPGFFNRNPEMMQVVYLFAMYIWFVPVLFFILSGLIILLQEKSARLK